MQFVYFIKDLVDQGRSHSRVVLTGSSMHSFLHQVRSLQVNGFSLWNNSKFVILGRPLSDSCVKAIGETIFSYHLQERNKQSLVGKTFDELLEQIKLNDQFSLSMTARPAVLNDIIATIPDSGDFAAGAKHSIDLLANKIQKETTTDIGKLFSEMRSQVSTLTFFRQVACGKSGSSGDMSVDRFISVLCGQDPDPLTFNSSQRQLLIPYSTIFQNFLTETGEFTVAMEDISQTAYLVPCDYLRAVLDFFVISQKSKLLSPESRKRISQAMMKRALALNLGAPKQTGSTELEEFTTVRQLLECPKILAMRIENFENTFPSLLSDPDRLQKVQAMIDNEKQSKAEPGMYLEQLFRNFISHNIANMIKSLHRLNWSLTDIYSLVRASVIALQKEHLDWVVFDKNGWPSAAVPKDAVQPGNSVAP